MQKLITGLHHFQSQVFHSHRKLFERLAKGQSPEALFITCSDSRVNPNLITQTNPGDLFIIRNAGNIIPAHGAPNGGEAATIEYAVVGLGVKDIIVCGHSLCGAMKGLLNPDDLKSMPAVADWLAHAAETRTCIESNYAHLDAEQQLNVAIQENVLMQLEHLKTHPSVAAGLSRGDLELHGWTYKLETGEVFSYQPEVEQFLPLVKNSSTTDHQFTPGDQNVQ